MEPVTTHHSDTEARTAHERKQAFRAFEASMMPLLRQFERTRKNCLTNIALSWLGVVVIAAIGANWWLSLYPGNIQLLVFAMLFVVGGCALIASFLLSSYKRDFKREVVMKVVAAYDASLSYFPLQYISQDKFTASQLFVKNIDRFKGEDHIQGARGKTDFEFSEIHAEYKTTTRSSKGRHQTQWHTIFKGIFFIADFHKDFTSHTVVLPDTAEKLFGFFGNTLQSMNVFRSELVTLEDPEFEREFCVYSNDQIDARYILSPSLMQRILACQKKFNCKLYLAFVQTKVYIAIAARKNYFEPRIFRPVDDVTMLGEFTTDLDSLISIVDDLNLNTRIWSKR